MLVKRVKQRKNKPTKEKSVATLGGKRRISELSGRRGTMIEAELAKGGSLQIVLTNMDMWELMVVWMGSIPAVSTELRADLERVDKLIASGEVPALSCKFLRRLCKQLVASHAGMGYVGSVLAMLQHNLAEAVDMQDDAINEVQDAKHRLLELLKGVEPQVPTTLPTRARPKKKAPVKKKAPAKKPYARRRKDYDLTAGLDKEFRIWEMGVKRHITKQKLRKAAGMGHRVVPVSDYDILKLGYKKLLQIPLAAADLDRITTAISVTYPNYLKDWESR